MLCCLLAGCFTTQPAHESRFKKHFENYDAVDSSQWVRLEVRLIETRLGDSYVNKELWDKSLDEQAVDFAERGILAKNGLRVGRVAGALPPRLAELMTLERTCLNPRMLFLAAGRVNTIHLGPAQAECQFRVALPGQNQPIDLAQAQLSLAVQPNLTEDGNIRLRFTPKVEYGNPIHTFQPAADRSGWMHEIKRQNQVFADLSWEVPLTPNTFLVIGGALDRPETLGHQAFVDRHSAPPVQRLLVLRTGRVTEAGIDSEIAPSPVNASVQTPPVPLAAQAPDSLVRAYHP
jgi:hypothetical protein